MPKESKYEIPIEVMKEIIASELNTPFGSKDRIRAKIKRWKDSEKLKKKEEQCRSE